MTARFLRFSSMNLEVTAIPLGIAGRRGRGAGTGSFGAQAPSVAHRATGSGTRGSPARRCLSRPGGGGMR